MNRFPVALNLTVLFVILFGLVFALPNIYGKDFAIQVAAESQDPLAAADVSRVTATLDGADVPYVAADIKDGRVLVRFADAQSQLEGQRSLVSDLAGDYLTALTLAPRTPQFLQNLGLDPMALGLDLRGGIHVMFEVAMEDYIGGIFERFRQDFRSLLTSERIRATGSTAGQDFVRLSFGSEEDLLRAETLITENDPDLVLTSRSDADTFELTVRLSEAQLRERQDFAIEQNITTIRNRVNELGVAEPVVQRQGLDRIVVQLPGVQDPTRVREILKSTSSLEFRLADPDNNAFEAQRTGRAPLGTRLYFERNGSPVLLKREIIVTGDQLTSATSRLTQDGLPAVFVELDAKGARRMLDTTKANLNRPMAVVLIEEKTRPVEKDGAIVDERFKEETVISVATIRGVFSNSFQITGLTNTEATDLALLLRAGSLVAPIFIVEERTIGPSLGKENIEKGFNAVVIGFVLVVLFMAGYYRVFGLVANMALIANLVLVIAMLSLLQASLTLPGIAGIVLTVGMAVDANVLIFERIREEIRNGNSPQASIAAGYDKALSSIADANITTLIAAIVLFTFGTGPIRGFAITLALGIITSMFTAIVGTRCVINLIYGGRSVERLAIGGARA